MVYLGTPGNGGTVILELPGTLPRLAAVKVRMALANARALGRREVSDELSDCLRSVRRAPE
jgi:hypothetical protein